MFLFPKLFRKLECGLSVLGLISAGTLIICNIIYNNPILFIFSLGTIPSTFIFFENTKIVHDMEKSLEQFKIDLEFFKKEHIRLNKNITDFLLLNDVKQKNINELHNLDDNISDLTLLLNSSSDDYDDDSIDNHINN